MGLQHVFHLTLAELVNMIQNSLPKACHLLRTAWELLRLRVEQKIFQAEVNCRTILRQAAEIEAGHALDPWTTPMDRPPGSMVLDLVQKIYELDHLDTVGVFYKGRSFVAHFTLNSTFTLDTRLFDDSLADLAVKCFWYNQSYFCFVDARYSLGLQGCALTSSPNSGDCIVFNPFGLQLVPDFIFRGFCCGHDND